MKMTFRNTAYFLLFLVVLTNYQCQKNPQDTPQPIDPLAEKVTASVKGRVTDENGRPVNNASVVSGGSSTTTDINGFFRFDNIQLAKNAGFVLVEKTGYLKGCRTIFTNAGIINNIEIQLIPKINRGSFSASAGGNIVIQSGSSVNFPAGGIINTSTNSVYTGTVNVIGAYLDPTDPKLSLIMPGNLIGLTTGNEQRLLQTFGMIAVELEGNNGEKLNLANGKSAAITMPIPATLLAGSPATIPLWYFDETKGLWKEEGTATKQGSNYVGTVTHFSFWNCDVPNNFVTLKLTIKDQNGKVASGYRVELRNTQNNSTAYATTDSAGSASGAVPPNVSMEMKVYNKCNTLVHSQTIGPFNTNTDLGVVTITIPAPATITVSGTVKNCSLSAVTNGYVDVIVDASAHRTAISNGNFSITIERCSNITSTAQIIATDLQANQQSTSMTLNVTSGNYSTGNITACGVSVLQFINFTIAGSPQNFLPPADSIFTYRQGFSTNIQGFCIHCDSVNYQYTSFNIDSVTAPGTYSIGSSFIVTKGIYPALGSRQYNLQSPGTLTITEFGSTGQYIAGSFSGTMREFYTNATVTGTCNFRVRRGF
ncbi:MAG TPA: carboxypeptidase-like regulatory domain-containing protein [Chitinophagaceae bacterium]|nr:carboxypeptidase-like regulatory domain-containing protein [Chitinophagaceae bacterium]